MRDYARDHFASMITKSSNDKMLNHLKPFCLWGAPQGLNAPESNFAKGVCDQHFEFFV